VKAAHRVPFVVVLVALTLFGPSAAPGVAVGVSPDSSSQCPSAQNATATSYEVRVTSCDHGNTKNYYGRSFFTSSVSYVDTPVYQVAACS